MRITTTTTIMLIGVSVGGPSISNIDPRLWAYLRILYARNEEDITKHGYTPFTLQAAGSILSADIETQVIKTLVGIVGIILRVYGSDMKVIYTFLLSFNLLFNPPPPFISFLFLFFSFLFFSFLFFSFIFFLLV